MTKLIALVTVAVFAAGTMFAGGHGDCAKKVGNKGKEKMACQVSLTSLNLSPEQKTKMDAAMAEHHKAGCNEASEAKYEEEAKGILSKDQFAKFKVEEKGKKEKTQS
jgi:Spy/CpxP family protein refolding chaperone